MAMKLGVTAQYNDESAKKKVKKKNLEHKVRMMFRLFQCTALLQIS